MAIERRHIAPLLAGTALVLALAGPAQAQLIVEQPRITDPPWNALTPFEPTPLPLLSDTRDPVAPEDTPVKNRPWPDYAAVGIRHGPWMYYPTATAGVFYDSNVFSSPTNREDDFATRFAAGLRAHSLWERHALDLSLSTDSKFYREHTSLNETNVDFNTKGRLDIDHSTQLLGKAQAAYLHDRRDRADAVRLPVRRAGAAQGIRPLYRIGRRSGRQLRLRLGARRQRRADQPGRARRPDLHGA
jgi:hypothetical protein